MRTLMSVFIVILFVASLSACGRKGQPEPPPGADYPRTYPAH